LSIKTAPVSDDPESDDSGSGDGAHGCLIDTAGYWCLMAPIVFSGSISVSAVMGIASFFTTKRSKRP
jgi:hypothetical protein